MAEIAKTALGIIWFLGSVGMAVAGGSLLMDDGSYWGVPLIIASILAIAAFANYVANDIFPQGPNNG